MADLPFTFLSSLADMPEMDTRPACERAPTFDIQEFHGGVPQADDITLLVLRSAPIG